MLSFVWTTNSRANARFKNPSRTLRTMNHRQFVFKCGRFAFDLRRPLIMSILALVQIAGSVETLLINMDTLLINEDGIPNGGRCGVLEPESA